MAFFIYHIKMLIEQGHQVDLACSIHKPISDNLIKMGCGVYEIPFSRKPIAKGNILAIIILKNLIADKHYDIIHTHTPNASAYVRWSLRKMNKIKIFYTAHGFHFYKGAPTFNWLLYYPIERWLSRYTDVLITINKEDYAIAKKFKAGRVEYIPGVGLDTQKFIDHTTGRIQIRKELDISDNAIVLLSVGEINKNKNHQIIIKALSKLMDMNIFYVIVGSGSKKRLDKLSNSLGISTQIRIIGWKKNVDDYYNAADIFCFPSRREGLGLAALEAMASGLPIITSNIHGICDYSQNGVTGFMVSYNDYIGFAESIKLLSSNEELRKVMGTHNQKIVKGFDTQVSVERIREIYKNTFDKLKLGVNI